MLTSKVYLEENVVNDRYRSCRYHTQKRRTQVSSFVGKLNTFISVHTVFIFLRILVTILPRYVFLYLQVILNTFDDSTTFTHSNSI